jgi:hypothetical protein
MIAVMAAELNAWLTKEGDLMEWVRKSALTKVGEAELTIHGKGEYKGSKSTTFMIAR